ncbi:MAG: RodZ domain-containing protein [Alphaproteobacteria bacterium]
MENTQDNDLMPQAPDPRPTVGDELRTQREESGQNIADVVDAVRIQRRYLEALEDGRSRDLPATVYALGFVRTYADHLGLNGADMVARYKEETKGFETTNDLTLPEPIDESKLPTTAIVIVAVILAAVAYGVWYFLFQPDGQVTQNVPDVPERLVGLIDDATPEAGDGMPVEEDIAAAPATPVAPLTPVPPATETKVETAVPPLVVSEPVKPVASPPAPAPTPPPAPEVATAPTPPPAPVVVEPEVVLAQPGVQPAITPATPAAPAAETEIAVVTPLAAPVGEIARTPRVYGQENQNSRVVIRALEDAWMEVTDADGALLFSRVLRKGDSYRAPNLPDAAFVTGNAGGLQVTVDGEPVPVLGPVGEVRHGVKLDPELLKAGTAWP